VVNTSPEPFSNVAVSTPGGRGTGGLLYLAYQYPEVAGVVALVLLALMVALLLLARRFIRRCSGAAAAPMGPTGN
jgi:hypothetical protein